MNDLPNPFNITKASDLSDQAINSLWVDLPGGHAEIGNPTSPMPMLIRGGKGSGKTHLMRYYSYPLQCIRAHGNIRSLIEEEGYLGVYFICGGLNADRFSGKGTDAEGWRRIFSFYMELWLGEHALDILTQFVEAADPLRVETERKIVADVMACFDRSPDEDIQTFDELRRLFVEARARVDLAINNAPFSGTLDVAVTVSPGRLIFGIPKAFWAHLPQWKNTLIVYLLDEFELMTVDQQRYVHTLIRARTSPCTVKVGGRSYGFKTYKTFSDNEENKDGSEFETVSLDGRLRNNPRYRRFAVQLCIRRLAEHGYSVPPIDDWDAGSSFLRDAFETSPETLLGIEETSYVPRDVAPAKRIYFQRLAKQLDDARNELTQFSVGSVIELLSFPDYPLVEKLNILSLYKDLSKGETDLEGCAKRINEEANALIRGEARKNPYRQRLAHFKADLLAQLRRDFKQRQVYNGIDTFIEMSEGLPRHILVILKRVFKWAVFYGEHPFAGSKISSRAQRAGVEHAAEWFLNDARSPGVDGHLVTVAIERLGELFRAIRFSDKPSECSICTFSVHYEACSAESRKMIDLAEQYSLLIKIPGGQKYRSSKRIDPKYQMNGILAPYWDLPVARRGAIALNEEEVEAIFSTKDGADFDTILRKRVRRLSASSFLKSKSGKTIEPTKDSHQQRFF